MRATQHDTAIRELNDRGFNMDWVTEHNSQATYDVAADRFTTDTVTADVLDYLEIEGQVIDGLFEDTHNGPDYDFTELFTLPGLIGRLMYFGVSFAGTDYTYQDLVNDIEYLATTRYNAPFNKQRVEQKYTTTTPNDEHGSEKGSDTTM
jgi:hypothetical protein